MDEDSPTALLSDVREMCEIVASTLGPFGANKLVVEDTGTVTMTSSGVELLERCDLENPAVELLRTAATGFRTEHGDGTSSLVALVGALLDEAVALREQGLHPTAIERGYRAGLEHARTYVTDHDLAVSEGGSEAVARTTLTATRDPTLRATLGDEIAEIATVVENDTGGQPFDRRNLAVVSRVGGTLGETELVRGAVLDDSPVLETMPRSADGGIALLSSNVDVARAGGEMSRRPGIVLTLSPDTFEERQAFDDNEMEQFEAAVEDAVGAGCQVIVTTASVNDRVKRTLANAGIMAIQRVDEADLARLARGTGGTVLGAFSEISAETLGQGTVTVQREAGRDMTRVETDSEQVYTVFCRAPDPRTLDAFSKSIESAVTAVTTANRTGRIVPGGGAIELGAAQAVRGAARSVETREQLAVNAFGDALTVIPRALAQTGSLDGTDAVIELRTEHDAGNHTTGFDALLGETKDVIAADAPVIEPRETKLAVWESAVDLAVQLLRIDAQLPARDLSTDDATDTERAAIEEQG